MLEELQFVQGAVATKDYEPALTHFHIKGGKILGYNGAVALCTPIDLNLECTPKATQFIKAIRICKDTVAMHMTESGRLAIRSGNFAAHVDCIDGESYPSVLPEGEAVDLSVEILEPLRSLTNFIAEDASRPWARGILLHGQSAYATNNIIAVERWIGQTVPATVNVPEEAVDELLRIGEEPKKLYTGANSITFEFAPDRWLRAQLLSTEWPNIIKILDKESNPTPIPPGFFEALHDLVAFTDDSSRVFFLDGMLSTVPEGGIGASVKVEGVPAGGCYNIKQMLHLEDVATQIDFSQYPNPCLFYGNNIRGAIVGMRF